MMENNYNINTCVTGMSKLSEYQLVLLEILKDIIKVCDKLKIKYYLTEGSCLGAVRHKGMIPWDDDIDIAIPVDDYNTFINEAPGMLNKKYVIKKRFEENDESRVIDTSIKIESGVLPGRFNPWVDIMVLYAMPNNTIIRQLHFYNFFFHQKLYKLSNIEGVIDRKRGHLESIVVALGRKYNIGSILNRQKCLENVKRVLTRYPYDACDFVIGFTSWYFKKEIMPKYVYGEGEMVPFEDFEVRIPKHYDIYLTNLYGDYMRLPPVEEREGKHEIKVIK